VIAIVVIHNWIRIFDPQDEEITDEAMGVWQSVASADERKWAIRFRHEIAKEYVPNDYMTWKSQHGRWGLILCIHLSSTYVAISPARYCFWASLLRIASSYWQHCSMSKEESVHCWTHLTIPSSASISAIASCMWSGSQDLHTLSLAITIFFTLPSYYPLHITPSPPWQFSQFLYDSVLAFELKKGSNIETISSYWSIFSLCRNGKSDLSSNALLSLFSFEPPGRVFGDTSAKWTCSQIEMVLLACALKSSQEPFCIYWYFNWSWRNAGSLLTILPHHDR
jgi:hypothetical protein